MLLLNIFTKINNAVPSVSRINCVIILTLKG